MQGGRVDAGETPIRIHLSNQRARRAGLVAILATSFSLSAYAQDDDRATREAALAQAAEGRCEAALPALRAAAADLAILQARAVCENAVGDPTAALEAVEAGNALGDASGELALQEGIAHFRLGNPVAAETALEKAEAAGANPPERLLYEGLVALALRKNESAVRALESARRLDPGHVEPVASYYVGLARTELGQDQEARAALEKVRDEWPGTPWADEAIRALAADDEGPDGPWLWLETGYEYDDNAVLRGSDVRLPREIPGQEDTRFHYRLQTGSMLWSNGPWALGGLFQLDGTIHNELHDFDVTEPSLSLWIDRALTPETLARFELQTRYTWLESDPFRQAHAASLIVHHGWSKTVATTLRAGFHRENNRFSDEDIADGPGRVGAPCLSSSDLICSPPGVDESRVRNRDGNGFWIGAVQQVELGQRASVWGGYRFRRFSARGAEYSFASHEWELGTLIRLPAAFDLQLSGRYAFRAYRHSTSFPEPDAVFAGVQYGLRSGARRERDLRTEVILGRALTQQLRVEARWTHERVRSTASVFDYRRDRFGGYLILAFGSLGGGDS